MNEKNIIPCPCCLSEQNTFFLCNAGDDKQYKQYQCSQCGYQFTWPCPSAEEIDRYYASESYYKASATRATTGDYSDYDSQIEGTLIFFRNLLKQLNLPENSAMLDVGCAKGRFMELAKKEFGLKCSGVELSDYARDYVQEHYHGMFPVWKSLQDMPVQEKEFDLILLFDVIEHVNSPWDILLGLFQRGCVGETTKILITTPNCSHKRAVENPDTWEYRYPPAHLSFCTPETFQKIGEKLLFRNIDISGHSQREMGEFWLQTPLQKTYAGYDGLICSFSGTSLAEIPPQEFPASLEELNRSEKYVSLLSSFIFEKKSSPINPEFGKFISDYCGSLNLFKSQYQDLQQRYSNLEEGWKAEHQYNQEQAQKREVLEKELAAENRKNALLKEVYEKTVTDNNNLCNENAKINNQRYDMWLEIKRMLSTTEQHLSYISHLENQVRELVPYKEQLENQVREFSEKLNEVYHSNSYRIGRLITCPVRKCMSFISRIKNKRQEWKKVKKECGTGYMWKCIFRKLTGRPDYRCYDVISSIGVFCEISFNMSRVNGFVDSYPLIWSFVHSLKMLPEVIKNPMILSGDQPMKHDYSCNMVRYTNVDISFHCKNHAEALLGTDGTVDESKAQAERDELKSRLTYLSGKWKKVLEDPDKKVLLILSPFEDQCSTEDVLAIQEAVKMYPAVDLLTVLTGKEKSVSAAALRSKGIIVRYIKKHPPHDKATDIAANDVKGWNRIFHEFRPLQKKISNKVYKYEN